MVAALYMIVSGMLSDSAVSFINLGWRLSRPGDLSIFSLSNALVTVSLVIINLSILCSTCLCSSLGTSPSGSLVKTPLKNSASNETHYSGPPKGTSVSWVGCINSQPASFGGNVK